MPAMHILLIVSTAIIYILTVTAIVGHGWLWPVVAVQDLAALNWRSQFNFDFIIYLILFSVWITWREGATVKGYVFGFLNIFLGGMFGFPYLLLATYRAEGDVKDILLGVNARKQ